MFHITHGKGFHITFQNGWTVSVQFGPGNYCNNRDFNPSKWGDEREAGAKGSATAKIAAWDAKGNWYRFDGDTVQGYQSPEEVLAFMNRIAALPA